MKVEFRTVFSQSKWYEAYPDQTTVMPSSGLFIRVTGNGDHVRRIILDGREVEWNEGQGIAEMDCVNTDHQHHVLVVVAPNGSGTRYEFAGVPESDNGERLSDTLVGIYNELRNLAVKGQVGLDQVFRAIQDRILQLLAHTNPITGTGYDFILTEYEKALPSLFRVCDAPRTHLRRDEIVRPVEVVRRIGPATIRHLASHSEHWHARTIRGLRPARLYSEILEDDLTIYENRFVKTLIDRIEQDLSAKTRSVIRACDESQNLAEWDNLINEFGDYRRQQIISMLLPPDNRAEHTGRLSSLRKRMETLQNMMRQCRNTQLYRAFSDHKPVTSPVRPTNILVMDPDYRPLFDLWGKMDKDASDKQDAIAGARSVEPRYAYSAFCQIMLLVAVRGAGFTPVARSQPAGSFHEDGQFIAKGSFNRGDWMVSMDLLNSADTPDTIELALVRRYNKRFDFPKGVEPPGPLPANMSDFAVADESGLAFSRIPTADEFDQLRMLMHVKQPRQRSENKANWKSSIQKDQSWRKFIADVRNNMPQTEELRVHLVISLTEIGSESQQVTQLTRYLLDSAANHTAAKGIAGTLMLIPTSPRTVSGHIPPGVTRRIVSYGDGLAKQDMALWGDRKAGILPISPWQSNSVLRLIRLLNTYTSGRDVSAERVLPRCPICDSESTHRTKGHTFRCMSCGGEWGTAICSDPKCGHKFGWIRPKVANVPQGNDWGSSAYGAWIEHLENAVGGIVSVSFCESPDERAANVPICPKCGHCSRSERHHGQCWRCSAAN